MNKFTLLSLLCGGLLVLNIILMIMHYRHLPPSHPPGGPGKQADPAEMLTKKLHLDEAQGKIFHKMRAAHMQKNEAINSEIFNAYDALFDLLLESEMNEDKKNQLFRKIEGLTMELNTSNFDHFTSLKSILKEDQISYFLSFTRDLRRKFGHQDGNQRPPKR